MDFVLSGTKLTVCVREVSVRRGCTVLSYCEVVSIYTVKVVSVHVYIHVYVVVQKFWGGECLKIFKPIRFLFPFVPDYGTVHVINTAQRKIYIY